jgi:hypothetical protein
MWNTVAARRLASVGVLLAGLVAGGARAAETPPSASPPAAAPAAAVPRTPAQDAALRQLKRPTGTGGCLFLSIPTEVRREALISVSTRARTPMPYRQAMAAAAPQCTTRPWSDNDPHLVAVAHGVLQQAGTAVILAGEFAVPQDRLDQAWAAASPEQKAVFYTAADMMLTPGPATSPTPPDVSALASAAGVAPERHAAAAPWLRSYYLSLATLERAEAVLAPQAKAP